MVEYHTMAAVLPAFLLATVVIAMLPGPATALIIREAASGDRRRVVGVIAGVEAAIFAWAVFAGLGVAALVTASALAYAVLRAVGAGVLIVIGLQTLWDARKSTTKRRRRNVLTLKGFRGGLLTNLANPKAAVFAFSFYPQFIPHGANVLATCVLLGAIQFLVEVAWYSTLATAVTGLRRFIDRSAVKRWIERVVGTVLIALGLRVAIG